MVEVAMSLRMGTDERESFLGDVHIGVVAVADGDRGPLTVPVWYSYEPGGEVVFVTDRSSRKARLLGLGVRMSLCVQNEDLPYKYVSVEGPVVSVEEARIEADVGPIARRYLGDRLGENYVASVLAEADPRPQVVIRMKPERWYTVDYSKR